MKFKKKKNLETQKLTGRGQQAPGTVADTFQVLLCKAPKVNSLYLADDETEASYSWEEADRFRGGQLDSSPLDFGQSRASSLE